ncbi:uncharacterized protein LOC142328097 isoform X2 [Lycorma delicatula]|uniref:uncharacterized protein LOC142328097 isoform X2 n=1 Tax=Lycorma delicatula TaxID=130591 RepID=UPI003F50F87A
MKNLTDGKFLAASILFALSFVHQYCVLGVQITDLRVPPSVRNGSASVLLDCEYTLRPDETSTDSGLVVKWFFNKTPAPVYQWIPGNKPQELGILKGRLNLDHRASHHPATMHRALYILNPTTDLAGEYKCAVSTFDDEDFMIKTMIVYAPEQRMDVVLAKTETEAVNVTCKAQGVYPEPRLTLYKDPEQNNKRPMNGVTLDSRQRDGAYDVAASTRLQDEELNTTAVIDCELLIPGTDYQKRKTITYHPGQALAWTGSVHCCKLQM